MTFDPFTATFEQAQAMPHAHAPRGPVAQWAGAQELLGRRPFFEANPLDGIALCCTRDLVAPEWLARAFLRGFYKVTTCRARSWDEAFGAALPKGANLAAARRTRENRLRVALAVTDITDRDPARATDKALFEAAGKAAGEGATRAEELWREALALRMAHKPRRSKPAGFAKLAGIPKRR